MLKRPTVVLLLILLVCYFLAGIAYGDNAAGLIGMVFVWLLVYVVYMLPAMLAEDRRHAHSLQIFILNLFLGWTLIGWVGALIWATFRVEGSRA